VASACFRCAAHTYGLPWLECTQFKITIGGVTVARNGMRDPGYKEADILPHMKGGSYRS
jgi:hypothetical protein